MTDAWDFSTNKSNTSYTKIDYTKFPVGITRIRIVDDAPYMRWAHWWPASKRYITCPGKDCPVCAIRRNQKANGEPVTINMTRRYSINVINKESGKLEVLEQGVGFFEEVKEMKDALQAKGLSLVDGDINVKRKGTDVNDTSYRLDLGENYPLLPNEQKLLSNKIDFTENLKPPEPEQILKLLNGEKWEDVMYNNNNENNTSSEADEEVELK